MEFQTLVETRRSIRRFSQQEVEDKVIMDLINAARYAPSWKNSQVTRYYAIIDEQVKNKVLNALPEYNQLAAGSAPVIIIASVITNRSGYRRDGSFETDKGKGWQMYDCGCSNMLLTLKAKELGLGSVIMGIYNEEELVKSIGLPETEEVVCVIALGYYDEEVAMPKRKTTEELVTFIK